MQIMKARLETALHILQRTLENDYQATSRAKEVFDDHFRLVMNSPLDLEQVSQEEIEKKVNSVIEQNLEVTEKVYEREAVPSNVSISTLNKDIQEIRVVSVGDFDSNACHHLHVKNTSEIGAFSIIEIRKNGEDTYKFTCKVE